MPTAADESMFKIILIIAKLKRTMASERVIGIMVDRAESGLWNNRLLPLEYMRDPKKYQFPFLKTEKR